MAAGEHKPWCGDVSLSRPVDRCTCADVPASHVAVNSPSKPRSSDPLVRALADMLARIEANYRREGSGPGSRFEGRLLEDVQAQAVTAMARSQGPAPDELAARAAAVAEEALALAEHLAHVLGSSQGLDQVHALRRRLAGER